MKKFLTFLMALMLLSNIASADYTISLDSTQTVYSNELTFDEPGTPTGAIDPTSFSMLGILELQAGDGVPQVNDHSGFGPWLGTDNSFFGNFGVFLTFEDDVTDFNVNIQDPSGPPSPFGGGAIAFVFDDGVEVTNFAFTPAWGGVGDEWLNINATGGMVFDEVRILGFGFGPTTFADDLSWNAASAIPEPASASLVLLFAGIAAVRRRR